MGYRVSVVIPVYNCEKFIERAVKSVLSQGNPEQYQIILVDDGSTDNSGRVCDLLSQNYSHVYAYHQKNAGVSAARNLGIEKSEGEWISFLDCDDYLLDGFFDKLICEPYADLLCCDFDIGNEGFPLIHGKIKEGVYKREDFKAVLYPVMAENTTFYSACNKIFRANIIKNNNLRFVNGMKLAEDMTFTYEYVKLINSFKFHDEKLYHYYINDNNTTSVVKRSYETYRSTYLYLKAYFKAVDDDNKLFATLQTGFLNNAIGSIFTASGHLGFFEALKYIRFIISDDVFHNDYTACRILSHSNGGLYGFLDKYVYSKNAFVILVACKVTEIYVKIKTFRGNKND